MPRGAVVLVALALVTVSGTAPAMSKSAIPPGFSVVATTDLYTGVRYLKLAKTTKTPVVAHLAYVAPGAPVDLRVVNANDKVSTSTRELETTSSMCRRVQCIVGINGDFHTAGAPAGAVIVDRRMLHSPHPARPQVSVTGDGRLVAGAFPWSGSLTAGAIQIPVVTVNETPPAGGLAIYTPDYGARTESSTRTELVVRATGPLGLLNQPTGVEPRSLRSGAGPIPADGAVLSADGAGAQQLRDLWAKHQKGNASPAQLLVSSSIDAVVSLGAEPVVLRDSKRALPWRDPNLIYPRQPHTLVGWNKEGETYLVAVDGRQAGSEGMTMAEAADFLVALGATDAVNLDGGGGTTFVAGGSVWNRPSDNHPQRPAEYSERGGANALVITSRPGNPLPPEAPPPPAPLAAPSEPGGEGGGTDRGSQGFDFFGGVLLNGQPIGPVSGVGGELAPGELPVGPAPAARKAARSKSPRSAAVDIEPSAGAGADVQPDPTSTPSDATSAGPTSENKPAGGPSKLGPSMLASQAIDAAIGGDSTGMGLALGGGVGTVVAGSLAAVVRRRRRRTLWV